MTPDEWTRVRIGWLRGMMWETRCEIAGWTIREGRQVAECAYEMDDDAPRPLRRGDLYFTPDGTAFLRVETVWPEELRGRDDVRLRLPTAGEMLVRVNGEYIGGIDPNRETLLLPQAPDGRLVIEIEGYNRSKPDDDRSEAASRAKGCRQVFQGAFLVTPNADAAALYYDIFVFWDLLKGGLLDEDEAAALSERLYRALDLVDWDTGGGLREARQYVRDRLYGAPWRRGGGEIALVGYSHLDIAYYWRRIHAVQKNARTCLIQWELMERYPFFRYAHTQAYLFETLETYYPEVFQRVLSAVKSGRFEPAGGMYVESDCNLSSAEGLARQFLYGQTYFRDTFGKICTNCWLPDVFGNSAVLPQILRKSGIRYFVSNKMSTWNDTNVFPHNSFIWRGLDGSEVYACVPPTHFVTAATPTEILGNWAAYQDKESGVPSLCMYGYGDGGSGVTEDMLETISRLDDAPFLPKVRVMGAEEFLSAGFGPDKHLAVWDGELYLEMHRGTFTTKAELKKMHRRMEILLRDAEYACALRALRGGDGADDGLRAAWKKLLVNAFHDILPGSHIHPVYEDALADYAAVNEMGEKLLAPSGSRWYNTLSFARMLPAFVPDETGPVVRQGARGRYIRGGMGPLGPVDPAPERTDTAWLTLSEEPGGALRLATALMDVVILPDGSLKSLRDETGREYVRGEFNRLRLWRDIPGHYDAWDILPTYRDISLPIETVEPIRLLRADGETAELRCVLGTQKSRFIRTLRLFRDRREIEVEHHVSWHEDHALLKAEFDCEVRAPYALCDLSAGFIARETNRNTTWQQARFEVCHHKWVDLSETDGGVAIINDGKYGVGLWDSMISLSLLRATCRPDLTADRGEHDFGYLIAPHAGSAPDAGIDRLALEYNTPLRRLDLPRMRLPELGSLFLQALKRSEDGRCIILRLSEHDGRRGTLRFPFPVRVMNLLEDEQETTDAVAYRPFEILTLGIAPDDARRLLEP